VLSEFAGVKLRLLEGWVDISADLPLGSPATLARETGVGALQFSVAKYESGAKPAIGEKELKRFFFNFCQEHSFERIEPSAKWSGTSLCVYGIRRTSGEVVAIWYLSNGTDIALITYTCLQQEDAVVTKELAEAQVMVESVEFG
jgi:hypothetical protein